MQFIRNLMVYSPVLQEIAFTIMRVGMGILFMGHGYLKLIGGPAKWLWLGQQMGHIGITFMPVFWGCCAMLSELVGGFCLTIGFGTRIAAAFLSFVMFMAFMFHIKNGDSYSIYALALSQMLIFIGLVIAGGGRWSVDYMISPK